MRNQKKRLDKISVNLSAKERSFAILDAVRRNDMTTAISLEEDTPKKSYRGPDAAVRQTIDAAENLSLRFDRSFYSAILLLQIADDVEDDDVNDVVSKIESEIYANISGLELFAERVGLSLERLLAYSTASEFNFVQLYQRDLETLSEEEMEQAQLACSAIEYLWKSYAGLSAFNVTA